MITDMRYIIRNGEKVLQMEIENKLHGGILEYKWYDVLVEEANDE